MFKLTEFNNREQLDISFAKEVATILTDAINTRGQASIAVSGGSTPKGFFNCLSNQDVAWQKVTITLVDERWVAGDNSASNTKLVKDNLLQNLAAKAKFFELYRDESLADDLLTRLSESAQHTFLPFDVVVLGMGEDGHTASLFPCCEQLTEGLALTSSNALLKTVPTTAPHDRITFNFKTLIESRHLFLHISGASKKDVLNLALSDENVEKMPIRAFLQHPEKHTQVYWAE